MWWTFSLWKMPSWTSGKEWTDISVTGEVLFESGGA